MYFRIHERHFLIICVCDFTRDGEEQKGWGSRAREILLHVFGNETQVKQV